jgi:hypothetical protein
LLVFFFSMQILWKIASLCYGSAGTRLALSFQQPFRQFSVRRRNAMQHVHKWEPLGQQTSPVAPLRITTVRPSVWERATARIEKTLSTEAAAEAVFGVATVLLTAVLFVSLARALAHYTIIPWP